ncbi:MAG: 4Fe-4S dicluster domain-containing protein, partial [Chloroflexota bacterium]
VHHPVTVLLDEAPDPSEETIYENEDAPPELTRLVDCIECGLCMSACPVMLTDPDYLGPAVLAAAQFAGLEQEPGLLKLVDGQDGVWRCHSIYECTAVCPSYVEPAWRIMDLRKQVIKQKIRGFFNGKRRQGKNGNQ